VIKYQSKSPGITIIKDIRILVGIIKPKILISIKSMGMINKSIATRYIYPTTINITIRITIPLILGYLYNKNTVINAKTPVIIVIVIKSIVEFINNVVKIAKKPHIIEIM